MDESGVHWSQWAGVSGVRELDFPAEYERYEARALLGRGGMGEVHLAWDRRLQREVAIKRAREDAPEEVSALLLQEGRLTAHLQHPGIVSVHDLGLDSDGRPWVVMDILRGQTLAIVMEDLDLVSRVRILAVVSEALAFAHGMGVVHRDMKPSNVFIGEHGVVQIGDWGLSATMNGYGWDEILGDRTSVLAAGTPGYQAPEQVEGVRITPACDVYGLGAMLWEMLEGSVPGASPTLPDASSELHAVAAKALQRDPEARYPTAAEMAQDLRRWLEGRRVEAHSYNPLELLRRVLWTWRAPITVGLIAGCAIGLTLLAALVQTSEERDRAQTAKEEALIALDKSDRNYARALASQSLAAWLRGATAEAEVLAAGSWEVHPTPEARGLLGGLALEAHPERVSAYSIADTTCEQLWLTGDGGIYCAEREALSRWTLGAERPDWRVPYTVEQLVTSGGRLSVRLDESSGWQLVTLEPETGSSVAVQEFVPGEVELRGDTIFSWSPDWVALTRGGQREEAVPCGRGAILDATLSKDASRIFALCRSGLVAIGDTTLEFEHVRMPDAADATSLHLVDDAGLAVLGTSYGAVLKVDLRSGEVFWRTNAASGPIQEICQDSQGGRVMAVADRGAPVVILLQNGIISHRFPARMRGSCAFREDGTLLLATSRRRISAWDLGPAGRAQYQAGAGVSWARSWGDGVAVLTGEGAVEFHTANAGVERRKWQQRVLKYGAITADGRLLVASLSDAGFTLFDQELARSQHEDKSLYRRIGVLPSGRWWGARYSTGVSLYDPDTEAWSTVSGSAGHKFFEGWGARDRLLHFFVDESGTIWRLVDGDSVSMHPVIRVTEGSPVAVAGDEDVIVYSTRRGLVVHDAQGALREVIETSSLTVDLDLSADGRYIAAGMLDGTVHVYEITGALAAVFPGHEQRVASVAFDEPGVVLSGSWDGSIRRWRLLNDIQPEAIYEAWGIDVAEALD